MPKTAVEAHFDYLVSRVIWPYFKARGYQKKGNNFRCLHADGSGRILNFQKSVSGNKYDICFTLNAGMYLPEGHPFRPRSTFTEPECCIRSRINALQPGRKDPWYELNVATDVPDLFQAVEADVMMYFLPFLDPMSSRVAILSALASGRLRADSLTTQLTVLQANGYLDAVRQQWQQAWSSSTLNYQRKQLQLLASELGLAEPLQP